MSDLTDCVKAFNLNSQTKCSVKVKAHLSCFFKIYFTLLEKHKRPFEESERFFVFVVIVMSVRFGSVRAVEY